MSKRTKAKVRIVQLSCDWKESLTGEELTAAGKSVGGTAFFCSYDQDVVDSKVMYVSSVELSQMELDLLWANGDLTMGDKDVWKGDTVTDIMTQLAKHIEEVTEEEIEAQASPQEVECPECNQAIRFHCIEGNHQFL